MTNFNRARELLHDFKGNSYLFGQEVLPQVGKRIAAA